MGEKRILIPLDFSECAKNALEAAIIFAKKMDADLYLIHAMMAFVNEAEIASQTLFEEANETEEQDVKENFETLKKEFPQLMGINHTILFKSGFPADVITEAMENHKIDFTIMGTKGARGADEILLGTITYRVIRDSKKPVIAIPENVQPHYFKNIALASDYKSIKNISSLNPVNYLARLFRSRIHILHISQYDRLSDREALEARKLEDHFRNLDHNYQFVINENVEEGINDYIESHNIDLLVMLPRKHNLFHVLFKENWTEKMAYHTKIPLMTLHE